MMFVYRTAMVSAPGAAQGSLFGVRLIARVVPRVAPLVRSPNGYVEGSGHEGRSRRRLIMVNLLVQACVGRVFKDVVLPSVMEVVQV